MTKADKKPIYERVTETLIAAIEAGAGKWEMPWHRSGFNLPYNALTTKPYQGMNTILLWCTNRSSNEWATYNQWATLGAQVRKGEKGTACVKWVEIKDKKKKANPKDKKTLIPAGFTVFNAEQVDGYEPKALASLVDETTKIANADAAIKKTGAIIRYAGDRACYIPSIDNIVIPPRKTFKDTKTSTATENFYATELHELVHWTGHKSRLDRFGKHQDRFSTDAYAFEELIADIGSAFACVRLGIVNEPRADHAQYLSSWLKILRADSKAIMTAASSAQKACNFILADEQQLSLPGEELQKEAA